MAAAVSAAPGVGMPTEWARKYPPLFALVAAFVIALAVLPSALNVPQTNPSQTLEYAPVPPNDDNPPPPPSGNFSSLGLAGSNTLSNTPGDDDLAGRTPPPVVGKSPTTKRCVGNPPRQTEDPLSPPCVANFQGDNFGATYQGVTGEEIRVLIYEDGNINYVSGSQGAEVTPDNTYWDLGQPPKDNEHIVVRSLRAWQQYFNDRYQTYGRFVHFYVYFGGSDDSVEAVRADASDNYSRIKPFAVMDFRPEFADDYLDYMAKRGVLNFGAFVGRDASFFQKYPKLIWGYAPSIQQQATMVSSYICTKVAPYKASYAGASTGYNGQPRKYGLWYTSDAGAQNLRNLKDAIVDQIDKCGIPKGSLVTHTFPGSKYTQDAHYAPSYAAKAAADFRQQNVTTLIWPGGVETNLGNSASDLGWYPEIVAAGDQNMENSGYADDQNQQFWENAVIITNVTLVSTQTEQPCFTSYRDADPQAPSSDITYVACRYYNQLRQLFIGIQVAGPRLGPTSIDKGFHAIPPTPSKDPKTPACFYLPGDYTCVKDATVYDYDSTRSRAGEGPNQGPCYRTYEGGRRYPANQWPEGDVITQKGGTADPCNNWSTGSGQFINPNPPSPSNPEGPSS